MATTVKVNLDPTEKILLKRNLNKNGQGQRFFANEVLRLSDPYVPMDTGMLKNNVSISLGGESIIYHSPYARAMWYGKVMAGSPRKPTNKNINFSGAPKRGKEWVNRAMADHKKDVVNAVAKFVGGRGE